MGTSKTSNSPLFITSKRAHTHTHTDIYSRTGEHIANINIYPLSRLKSRALRDVSQDASITPIYISVCIYIKCLRSEETGEIALLANRVSFSPLSELFPRLSTFLAANGLALSRSDFLARPQKTTLNKKKKKIKKKTTTRKHV